METRVARPGSCPARTAGAKRAESRKGSMKRADQILPAVLCGSLVLGLWAAPLRAQAQNQLASVGAAALATPEELSEQEVIRRKEQLIRGQKALADAEAAMKAGDFDKAAEYYTNALNPLPRGNVAAKEIATARAGVINAYISKGRASVRTKNYDDARKSADEVLKMTGRLPGGDVATVEIAAPGSPAANPGFDVTPARLVTAFITERGTCAANEEGLRELFPK